MPTKRKKEKATSRIGINSIRTLIEKNNDIFQEIDLENDVGNDAYIEFIMNEETTGCCIVSQIKSGKSYINSKGEHFFQSDKEHFEYWNSHLLPVCAFVHNPENDTTKWIDITKYLTENPYLIENGPYSLKCTSEFSGITFDVFKKHFLEYKNKMDYSFIKSLDILLENKSLSEINDAFHLLFTYFRNKKSTWYFICQYFKEAFNDQIIGMIVYKLSFVTGSHGDTFWHKKNMIDNEIRAYIKSLIGKTFEEAELIKLIEVFKENSFSRGTLSQAAHSIIDWIENKNELLFNISFNSNFDSDIKFSSLMLLLFYKNWEENSYSDSLKLLKEYKKTYPNSDDIEIIDSMIETILIDKYLDFY